MINTNIAVSEIIESKTQRQVYLDRIDVLEKVKKLAMNEHLDFMTMVEVADYFEVNAKAIDKLTGRHLEELKSSGYSVESLAKIRDILNGSVECVETRLVGKVVFTTPEGTEVIVPYRGLRAYRPSSLVYIALILHDSKVANEFQYRIKTKVKSSSSAGERVIEFILQDLQVFFKKQDKVTIENKNLYFDFGMYHLNKCLLYIEYDGDQHSTPIRFWGGEDGLEANITRDKMKNEYCKKKGIPLLRVSDTVDIKEKIVRILSL